MACDRPSIVFLSRLGQPTRHYLQSLIDLDTFLLRGVTIAQGNGSIFERLAIHGQAIGRTHLVVTPVALYNLVLFIVFRIDTGVEELMHDLPGKLGHSVPLHQRQHGNLVGRQAGVQALPHGGCGARPARSTRGSMRGAPGRGRGGRRAGCATYVEWGKLGASDAAAVDRLGWSVAFDGDTVVVICEWNAASPNFAWP